MWFESLVGFREQDGEHVRANLEVTNDSMVSKANGRHMICGTLETPNLAELRSAVREIESASGTLRLSGIVADVQALHVDAENAGALFQVSSQFNLLEMTSSVVTPEHGVDIYELDRTQGPAAGFLTGKYRPGQSIPKGSRFDVIPGHQPIYFTDHGYEVLEQLDKRVMETGRTHAELAMHWVLQQPGITSVLVGVRTTDHVDLAVNLLSD